MARRSNDIPLDQAVDLVRACQKFNCDTAEELVDMVEKLQTELKAETLRADNAEAAGD